MYLHPGRQTFPKKLKETFCRRNLVVKNGDHLHNTLLPDLWKTSKTCQTFGAETVTSHCILELKPHPFKKEAEKVKK